MRNKVLWVLFFGVLMAALDIAIVGPALPAIKTAFAVDERSLAWVFNAYVLMNLVGTPLMAKLSDRYGRRPIYVLMMSTQYDQRSLIEALDSGADDFIGFPDAAQGRQFGHGRLLFLGLFRGEMEPVGVEHLGADGTGGDGVDPDADRSALLGQDASQVEQLLVRELNERLGGDLGQLVVPVPPEVDAICRALSVDPLRLVSSGSLLVAISHPQPLLAELAAAGIPAAVVGRITGEGRWLVSGGARFPLEPPEGDELWRARQVLMRRR